MESQGNSDHNCRVCQPWGRAGRCHYDSSHLCVGMTGVEPGDREAENVWTQGASSGWMQPRWAFVSTTLSPRCPTPLWML